MLLLPYSVIVIVLGLAPQDYTNSTVAEHFYPCYLQSMSMETKVYVGYNEGIDWLKELFVVHNSCWGYSESDIRR